MKFITLAVMSVFSVMGMVCLGNSVANNDALLALIGVILVSLGNVFAYILGLMVEGEERKYESLRNPRSR